MHHISSLAVFVRALRLPFVTASALPFIFGSFFASGHLDQTAFWLGLLAVVAAHVSANLINDYADSKSGADWNDRTSYQFFGGSKLIQEGVLTEKFYLALALIFSGFSAAALIVVAYLFQSTLVIYAALFIFFLSWSYSTKPFQLAYHRLGEFVIFILFGPAPVMGAYYLQTGIFPDLASFLVSIPFGLFTAAILYANEIPDFADDINAGKHNLANFFPRERAYFGYHALSLFGLVFIAVDVALGHLSLWSLLALLAIVPIFKAGAILKNFSSDKMRLIESSKLAIFNQTLVSLVLISLWNGWRE